MIVNFLTWILYGVAYLISLLPLRLLYLLSDVLWLLMYLFPFLKYRHRIVRRNLTSSFPDKSIREIRAIERRFYHNFLDLVMEMVKMFSISRRQILKRVELVNGNLVRELITEGKSIVVYLGHTGNWEWMNYLSLKFLDMIDGSLQFCHIYHKLENPVMDRLMIKLRGRFGSESIPMERTYRRFVDYKNENRTFVVAMVADQVPLMRNIHYWTDFMNHYTPVFTGAERIVRKLDLVPLYASVIRVRRGHYRFVVRPIVESTDGLEPFEITEKFMRMLESDIMSDPASWLWSHNRWKRTWEGYQEWLSNQKHLRQ